MNKENCALKLVDEIILYYDARSKRNIKESYTAFYVGRGKPKYLDHDLPQCHLVYYKTQAVSEPNSGLHGKRLATRRLTHGRVLLLSTETVEVD